MSNLEILLQQMFNPLVLWQRIALAGLLLLVVVCLVVLLQMNNQRKKLQSLRDDAKRNQQYRQDILMQKLQNVNPEPPIVTSDKPEKKPTNTSSTSQSYLSQLDVKQKINQLVDYWKTSQDASLPEQKRLKVLRDGIKLLEATQYDDAVSSNIKDNWPLMFDSEIRRVENKL